MKEFSEKEFLLLAYLEGDLTEEEKVKVKAMLAEDAALMREYNLLSKTVLPAEEVTYSSKASLKKPVATQKVALGYLFWSGAVAACLAVLIVLYAPKSNTSTTVATNTTTNSSTAKTEKELITPNTTENAVVENSDINKTETNVAVAVRKQPTKVVSSLPEDNNKAENTDATEPFDKESFATNMLASKPTTLPSVELPETRVTLNTDLQKPMLPTIGNTNNKYWLARKIYKINNTLDTWASYLQKPKVEIEKKEPLGGRTYWLVSLEAEEYEWEGRLYTRR